MCSGVLVCSGISMNRFISYFVTSNLGLSGPGSFRPVSFRPIFGMGRFGLGKWVALALGRFGPGSFWPESIETNKVQIFTTPA